MVLHADELAEWRRTTERPVFVVGVERSGTTLLRNLLSAHSRIAISPETHFMRLADAWGAANASGPDDFEAFWSALAGHLALRATGVDLARARALIRTSRDFRTVFAALLAAQAGQTGRLRAGEKTPGHEHDLARIFAWFPGAQVIFIHRDPRACAASALQTPWVQAQLRPGRLSAPLVRRARLWHVVAKAREWLESWRVERAWRGDGRVSSVAYEDLVLRPEAELQRLCDFLGEDFEAPMLGARSAGMIDPHKAGMRWREWTIAHERSAAAPISADGLDRWRRSLARAEVGVIEALCGAGMEDFGYELSQSRADMSWRRLGGAAVLWADRIEQSLRAAAKAAMRPGAAGA